MFNNFALTGKSRIKNWLRNLVTQIDTVGVFLHNIILLVSESGH